MITPKFKVRERVLLRSSWSTPLIVEKVLQTDAGISYQVKHLLSGAVIDLAESALMSTEEARKLKPKTLEERLNEVKKEELSS